MFKSKARGFPVNRYHFCLLARGAERAPESPSAVYGGVTDFQLLAGCPACSWQPAPTARAAAGAPAHPGSAWPWSWARARRRSQPRVRQLARGAAQSFTWLRVLMHLETAGFSLRFGHESKLGLESSGLVKLLWLQRCTTGWSQL